MKLSAVPRPNTPEQKLWMEQVRYWYCPHFPLEQLPEKRRGQTRNHSAKWFKNMLNDIKQNGLRSPILLNYSDTEHPLNPFPERPDFCINAGNHRFACADLLGWVSIPAVVWGKEPPWGETHGPFNVEQVNKLYIKDGYVELAWHGPVLRGASDATEEFGGGATG